VGQWDQFGIDTGYGETAWLWDYFGIDTGLWGREWGSGISLGLLPGYEGRAGQWD